MLEIIVHDTVAELRMTDADNDNTFRPDALKAWHRALDDIEAMPNISALLVTSSSEKTFSTGINLPWVQTQTPEQFMAFLDDFDRFYLRLATYPMPTVGAINGNAYAGGALMAAALDFRYMRADRGRLCFAEINIKLSFSEVMNAVLQLLPDSHATYEMIISGAAWGGEQCAERGIVDAAVSQEMLFDTALAKASGLAGKDRATFAAIKRDFRSNVSALARASGLIPAISQTPIEPPKI